MSGDPIGHETYYREGKPQNESYHQSFVRRTEVLKSLFPQAEIIVFFRKHGEFVTSIYKQHVKRGGWLTFNEFIHSHKTPCTRSKFDFSIEQKVKHLQRAFSKVHIYDYADLCDEPLLLISDLCELMGASYNKTLPRARVNEGLKGKKLDTRRWLNRIYYSLPQYIRYLLNKFNLTPELLTDSPFIQIFTKNKKGLASADSYSLKMNIEYCSDWDYFKANKRKFSST